MDDNTPIPCFYNYSKSTPFQGGTRETYCKKMNAQTAVDKDQSKYHQDDTSRSRTQMNKKRIKDQGNQNGASLAKDVAVDNWQPQ